MHRKVISLQTVAKVYPLELSHVVSEHHLLKAILANPVRRPSMECYNHFDRLRDTKTKPIVTFKFKEFLRKLPRRSDIESKNSQGASGNSPALTNET